MSVNFDQYQSFARSLAIRDEKGQHCSLPPGVYAALELTNEAGEAAGVLKKFHRDKTEFSDVRQALLGELGDVLYGLAMLADEFEINLQAVADYNVKKLTDRKNRGVLSGSGDNR